MIRMAKRIAARQIAAATGAGLLALSFAFVMTASVFAADLKPGFSSARPSTAPYDTLPFARSERAQSVWASGACWTQCGSYCAWGQTACLSRDAQGQCLKLTDDCDRYCQRSCRSSGGPWLPLDF
ncbi:MAG: hypothetical protein WC670_16000 [Pseudolabrys sp.]|jgi:hypothetical protein